jgi:hypothetical protein
MCLRGYKGRELPKVRKVLARKLGLRLEQMNKLITEFSTELDYQ